jgi:intracellular sulfur oxidation DsrE/DsrF family protein
MSDLFTSETHRRGFLGRAGAALALGLVARLPLPRPLAAEPAPGGDPMDKDDRWLDGLKGKHRQLFDMPAPNNGIPQLHIRNFMATYKEAYGMAEKDVNAVGTLYGMSTPLGFSDEMWEKYKFGAPLNVNDPATNAPLTRNMFAHPKEGDNFAFGFFDSSIEALQAKGVVFILCNNALNFWVGRLSKAGMGTTDDIRADLLAHILPKVVLVPGMVVAINKAQERGLSYMYLA